MKKKNKRKVVLSELHIGKSFEKNYILYAYYVYTFVFTMKVRFLKSITFLYLTNHLMVSMLLAF